MVTSANYAGDYEPQGSITFQASKGTSAAIVKGNVCIVTTGKWNAALTTDKSGTGGFAVATKAAATAATTVQLVKNAIIYVKGEGAITANTLVQLSATTAGAVMAFTASTLNTTNPTGTQLNDAALDFRRVVGLYLGHENEGDGQTIATDAVDGDTIRILMTGV